MKDLINSIVTTIIGGGVWIWLETNATAIGAAVGVVTIIWLILSICNLMAKWKRLYDLKQRIKSRKRREGR